MIKRVIALLKLKIKWKKRNQHNMTYLTNLCDIEQIHVGRYTYGPICVETFGCENTKLIIGQFCSVAQNVRFVLGGEHRLDCISTYPFQAKGNIIVNDDVWIGDSALILSGVEIGQGAVIAAGAVVTEDVPPYAVVGGVPAKVIKYRFRDDVIKELVKIDYAKVDRKFIERHEDIWYRKVMDTESVHDLLKELDRWQSRKIMH